MDGFTTSKGFYMAVIELQPALSAAIRAAHEAATILQHYAQRRDELTIDFKMHNDLVSEADQEAEAAIKAVLQTHCPDYGLIGEESGGRAHGDAFWVIDPLDGTTNFLHGLPFYVVSIALVAQAGIRLNNGYTTETVDPVIGLVYDPNRNECFTACHGEGAWLNQSRIHCSQPQRLEDALLSTGFPFREFNFADQYQPMMLQAMRKTRGLRRIGAAALDLAWVACGRFDGYWEMGLAPWDVAAGTLIAREAGALCQDLYQQEPWPASGDIYCAWPALAHQMHEQFIAPHLTRRKGPSPQWMQG